MITGVSWTRFEHTADLGSGRKVYSLPICAHDPDKCVRIYHRSFIYVCTDVYVSRRNDDNAPRNIDPS